MATALPPTTANDLPVWMHVHNARLRAAEREHVRSPVGDTAGGTPRPRPRPGSGSLRTEYRPRHAKPRTPPLRRRLHAWIERHHAVSHTAASAIVLAGAVASVLAAEVVLAI